MVHSLLQHRSLIYQLTRRNVVGRYRGSLAGFAWSFVIPLLMLMVYTFVFGVVFQLRWAGGERDTLDFAILLFMGLILHQFLAECLTRSPGLITGNRQYVKRVVFPLEVLAWVTVCTALFHAAISMAVLVTFVLVVKQVFHWTLVLIPVIVLPLALIGAGLSWWLAATTVFVRDLSHLVGLAVTVLLFLSPIFYPVDALPTGLQPLLYLNPLTYPIEALRGAIFWGHVPGLARIAAYYLVAFTVGWLGLVWFQRLRKGFADVV